MSDLRPKGIVVEIGEQEYDLLFTISAIDEIQEKCNAPLIDAIKAVAGAADGKTDRDTMDGFCKVLTVLVNRTAKEPVTEQDVKETLEIRTYQKTAWAVLNAYGISIPDPDEDDDFEDDEEPDPNGKTGQ